MNLALSLLPDWNSLDSVRDAHSSLELWSIWLFAALVVCDLVAHLIEDSHKPIAKFIERAGLLCFALAVAAELGAYKYGQRNDELAAGVIKSLDDKATDASSKAATAVTDSGTAVGQAKDAETKSGNAVKSASDAIATARDAHQEADWARDMASKAETTLADRSLTDEQVKTIAGKLSSFMGQPYTVTAYWDSKESMGITNRIHKALQMAGWLYSPEGSKSFLLGGAIGVEVWTHPDTDPSPKLAAASLIDALKVEGIDAIAKEQNLQNPKTNMISLVVGAKR
jgi:hypothetical protein